MAVRRNFGIVIQLTPSQQLIVNELMKTLSLERTTLLENATLRGITDLNRTYILKQPCRSYAAAIKKGNDPCNTPDKSS